MARLHDKLIATADVIAPIPSSWCHTAASTSTVCHVHVHGGNLLHSCCAGDSDLVGHETAQRRSTRW
jgi:hypothetical protein